MKLALVYLDEQGMSNVGFFDENGDIDKFHAFSADEPFENISDDVFVICEHKSSEVSDFILSPLGAIQVTLNDGNHTKCTVVEFLADPQRDKDAFKTIYHHALKALMEQKPEKFVGEGAPEGVTIH